MPNVALTTPQDIRDQMVLIEQPGLFATFAGFTAYDVEQNDAVPPFSFRLPLRRVPVPFTAGGDVAAAGRPLGRSFGWTWTNFVSVFVATSEFDPKDYGGMSQRASPFWVPYFDLYLPDSARTLNGYVNKLTIIDSHEGEFDMRWYGWYFDFQIEQYPTLTV